MKRPEWKAVAEVLGILGVVGSLVFVAMEVRQNTNAVRSSTIQAVLETSIAATTLSVEDAELRAARRAVCAGTLTEDQQQQLTAFYAVMVRVQLNRFYQSRLGIIDEETALELGGRGGVYRSPFFSDYWERVKERYGTGFREFIEAEVLPLSESDC